MCNSPPPIRQEVDVHQLAQITKLGLWPRHIVPVYQDSQLNLSAKPTSIGRAEIVGLRRVCCKRTAVILAKNQDFKVKLTRSVPRLGL